MANTKPFIVLISTIACNNQIRKLEVSFQVYLPCEKNKI